MIIVSPQNSTNLNKVLAEARGKGIKVIDFDRKASEDVYDVFIGADNHQLGYSAGEYLIEHLPANARFLEIYGLPDSSPAIERSRGFKDAIKDNGGAEVVAGAVGDWDKDKAERVADSLLRLYPDIDAIFAHNDRMAIGASAAARKLGHNNIFISGIDAVPTTGIKAVADSTITVTFMYPTAGKEILDLGMKLANGNEVSDEFLITSTQPIDKSNASILLELSQSIDNEKDKIGFLKNRVDEFASRHNVQKYIIAGILIFCITLTVGIFLILKAYWSRKKAQAELAKRNDMLLRQRDKLESLNIQLNEATQSKLTFFTNVSHDLRTPLTLIAEPIASLVDAPNLTAEQHTMIGLAEKNVLILRRLINQILDFRKFENGHLQLSLEEINLPKALNDWADAFRTLAKRRHIDYEVEFGSFETTHIAVDTEKLERIFFNIMSNAFKFTPDNGKISVKASSSADTFNLCIKDSGKGISADDLPHIFERFYQAEKIQPQGSGIGLAVVKAFTELHGGTVTAESEPGKGTTFFLQLPIRHIKDEHAPPVATSTLSERVVANDLTQLNDLDDKTICRELDIVDAPDEDINLSDDKPTALIIDDTTDMRILLRTLLSHEYNIVEASNGKQGIRLASKYIPDLIICDMMMPGMDGMECVRKIKDEISTSHIPVLMLTACRLDEQRAQAYEAGADGFVSKPFSENVLLSRCHSLIANRRRIAKSDIMPGSKDISKHIGNKMPDNIALTTEKTKTEKTQSKKFVAGKEKSVMNHDPMVVENEFYQKFLAIVDRELGNSEISVEDIGAQLGLSRVQFYRKIKALTNFSPGELLRMRRLKEAYRMLTSTESTVSEVAYAVGFSSPGYFAKCFKEQYDELPADLQKRTSKLK